VVGAVTFDVSIRPRQRLSVAGLVSSPLSESRCAQRGKSCSLFGVCVYGGERSRRQYHSLLHSNYSSPNAARNCVSMRWLRVSRLRLHRCCWSGPRRSNCEHAIVASAKQPNSVQRQKVSCCPSRDGKDEIENCESRQVKGKGKVTAIYMPTGACSGAAGRPATLVPRQS